jgi:ABC-type multidrug transport system fused ATPase/permease subunit
VQYWFYLRMIFDPIGEISERYNVLQSALSSTEKIRGLLDEPPERPDPDPGVAGSPARGEVVFDRVGFAYQPGTPVIRAMSFAIRPGETVAVVGATGAGKSTLAQLLLGFYRVDHGRVLVDGRDVQDWRLEELRRAVGVVPQDVFLFSDSILENVRLRDPSVSEEQVREACRLVGAAAFVERLPDGYHSTVGERGVTLSAGQRQLLAFARILVESPRILILDEATSAVDSETEAVLQQAVTRIVEGRTCVIIAHRLSTIRLADRILVLHHGELREVGTHEELLRHGGIYTRLHRLQFELP